MENKPDFDLDWNRFPLLMAHDLKGPLGNLVLYTNLAKEELQELKGADEDSVALLTNVVSQIQDSGTKLMFQIQCWVDAHLLKRGTYSIKQEFFDISTVIEAAIESVKAEYAMRHIPINHDVILSQKISGDQTLVSNVIKNLFQVIALFGIAGQPVVFRTTFDAKECCCTFECADSAGMERVLARLNCDFSGEIVIDTTEGVLKTGVFGMVYVSLAAKALNAHIDVSHVDSGLRIQFVIPKGM
jgi:light-regulated signal transduction histidine kinase (bacteriophytochrome)